MKSNFQNCSRDAKFSNLFERVSNASFENVTSYFQSAFQKPGRNGMKKHICIQIGARNSTWTFFCLILIVCTKIYKKQHFQRKIPWPWPYACAYSQNAILKHVLIDCDAYFDYHVFKKSLIVPDLLDIIILSQHYDMICWNSIYLANLINVRMTKCVRVCVTLPKDNLIILFIVLFFLSFFSSMGLLPKQDYIFMINIICVFLHFSHFRFQLFVFESLILLSSQGATDCKFSRKNDDFLLFTFLWYL